jgi:sugar phosphate isomerase/epimerase
MLSCYGSPLITSAEPPAIFTPSRLKKWRDRQIRESIPLTVEKMIRRQFLKSSFGALASISLHAAAPEPNVVFPTAPSDRLAVATWPFRKLVHPKTGTASLDDFAATIVSRFGVHGIEPLSDHFPSSDPSYLEKFGSALKKAGVHVVNIPVNPQGSLYDPADGNRLAAIKRTKHWIDVAKTLGAPSIRVSIEGADHSQPDKGLTAKSLGTIVQYGQQQNIVVNLENDDPVSEDAFFITSLISLVRNPFLRALPDFCNSMIEKHGDENFNDSALKAMFAHAYNISHVKDSERDGGSLYRVNLERCFAIAKSAGYRGYYSMEFEGDGEPFAGTEKLVEASLKYLS